MPGPGRNQPCPCGSGRKTKRCCGEHRGPSDQQLARAHLAELCHQTIHELDGLPDRALDHLADELFDLPALDLSLLVTLPRLIGPDLERLREAIEHDDPEWGRDALTAVHRQIDTPQQRAQLADAELAAPSAWWAGTERSTHVDEVGLHGARADRPGLWLVLGVRLVLSVVL